MRHAAAGVKLEANRTCKVRALAELGRRFVRLRSQYYRIIDR